MISWREFKYKNLSLVLLGLIIAFMISKDPTFQDFLRQLESHGYLGAFLGGVVFVSTFTFGIGLVILTSLIDSLSPVAIAFFAGLGALAGDLFIFKFVKDRLLSEIKPLYQRFGGNTLSKIFYSHFFAWTLPVLGAIIIASPLPDEIGVSLMGISKMKTSRFMLVSFLLNTIGIFLILLAYRAAKD